MMLKFACYFPAETPIFTVINIESDAWVQELLMAIADQLEEARVINLASNLRLFKVNLPILW